MADSQVPPLEDQDSAARGDVEALAGEGFALLDALLLHLNHGTSALTGRKHDQGLNFLIGLLLMKSFNSLWRARQDIAHGYASQGLILCRSAFEDWVTARWVELHPDERDLWLWRILDGVEQPPAGRKIPGLDAMLAEVLPPESSPILRSVYDTLSKFAHPRGTSLRWGVHWDEENSYFHVGPFVDATNTRAGLFFLVATAQASFNLIARLQERILGKPDANWSERARLLSTRTEEYMNEVGSGPDQSEGGV